MAVPELNTTGCRALRIQETYKKNTVNALLVPAGTILFRPLEVRVLFKRGHNSRAGTNKKYPKSDPKITQNSAF